MPTTKKTREVKVKAWAVLALGRGIPIGAELYRRIYASSNMAVFRRKWQAEKYYCEDLDKIVPCTITYSLPKKITRIVKKK